MRIYGASDDLVEIEGVDMGDEIGCYDRDVRIFVGERGNGVQVVMSYAPDDVDDGVWQARLAPMAEDEPCPWDVALKCEGYSAVVEIDCPKDTPITVETRARKDNGGTWKPVATAEED